MAKSGETTLILEHWIITHDQNARAPSFESKVTKLTAGYKAIFGPALFLPTRRVYVATPLLQLSCFTVRDSVPRIVKKANRRNAKT